MNKRINFEPKGFTRPVHMLAAMLLFLLLAMPAPAPAAMATLPSFADLAKQVGPAVVNISVVKDVKTQGLQPSPGQFHRGEDPFEDFMRRFFGNQIPREYKQRALGSGFVFDSKGYIITNNHVVDDADKIEVRLSDKHTYPAKIVGRDPKTDIALIKLDSDGPFPYLPLGDSDAIRVGDWVLAVGNPFGLENTVTQGIISAKQRNIGAGPYDDFLQTDASINPGNSGGPLINMDGQVVGVNTAIVASGQGIGFAIPSNMVKTIVAQLKEHGKVVRGWLGVMIQKITPELMKSFSLKDDKGALVADVPAGSPAEKAGIKRGDVIVEYNGKKIEEWSDLPTMVATTAVGTSVPIKVIRNGKEKAIEVTVGEMKETKTGAATATPGEEDKLGFTVQELTPELAKQLGIDQENGVVINDVVQGGTAAEAGLRPGDVIEEINRQPIKSMDDYSRVVKSLPAKEDVLLLVRRGNNTFFVTLSLG